MNGTRSDPKSRQTNMKLQHLLGGVALAATQTQALWLGLRTGHASWGAGSRNSGEAKTCFALAADNPDKFASYKDHSRMVGNSCGQSINEYLNQINGLWIENHNINFLKDGTHWYCNPGDCSEAGIGVGTVCQCDAGAGAPQ